MKIILGLGNPGLEYSATRHNVGFWLLDNLAKKYHATWIDKKSKFSAMVAEIDINGEKVILIKPTTYYNLVGQSLVKVMHFYKLTLDDVLVIHDEMALPIGTIRTRLGGSDAGNNGIKNIIAVLGGNFRRIRIGTGLKPVRDGNSQPNNNRRNFVLGKLNSQEQGILDDSLSVLHDVISKFAQGYFTETTFRQP